MYIYYFCISKLAAISIPGRVYELDGLKPGPVDLGPYTDDWINVVRPLLQSRISKHAATEITFNLMAVVGDKLVDYQRHLEGLTAEHEIQGLKEKIRVEEEKRTNYKVCVSGGGKIAYFLISFRKFYFIHLVFEIGTVIRLIV